VAGQSTFRLLDDCIGVERFHPSGFHVGQAVVDLAFQFGQGLIAERLVQFPIAHRYAAPRALRSRT
jgi:hypothetical protein